METDAALATSPQSPVKKKKKKANLKIKKGIQDGISTDEAPTPNPKKEKRTRAISDNNFEATMDEKKLEVTKKPPKHIRQASSKDNGNFDGFET